MDNNMLTETQLDKFASVLLWGLKKARRKPFRRGDVVRVVYDLPAVRLAERVHERLVRAGVHLILRTGDTPCMERNFYGLGDGRQLAFTAAGTRQLFHTLNGSVHISAPESLTHLRDINPSRMGISMVARKPFREILNRREEKGLFGWTLCTLPTKALAEKAGTSLGAYTQQIIKACYLDKKDPVNAWESIYKRALRIKKWLKKLQIRKLHVESANTDLWLLLGERRKWLGVSGHNIPSFEIFTSPDWRGTEGVYYSNLPSYRSGNFVDGVHLEFRRGCAKKQTAKKGEKFVRKMAALDAFADKIGEFSLTDNRFSRITRFMADTLYDENFGGPHGNCHLALGASYSDTFDGDPAVLTKARKKALGFNDSSLHWDLVNTEKKRVTALLKGGGRKVIYENGRFTA
jgi:aminopeptidase